MRLAGFAAVLLALAGTAQAADPVPAEIDGVMITSKIIATGLEEPVFLASPPGDERLFILEKAGRIRIIADGAVLETPFLDITEMVSTERERGLLGLAFDPDYASNGRLFINYTAAGTGEINVASVATSADPNVADKASLASILTITHVSQDQNGGWLGFGPDGYLYVAVGDDSVLAHGQDTNVLLGKILRIDVRSTVPYAIPPDNPFANGGGAPEIFAYGLRNPWRNSFDGDNLYVGDVGDHLRDEINVLPLATKGANFGWSEFEGDKCRGTKCETMVAIAPIHTYPIIDGKCAVVGGYVYRGKAIPALNGRYFYTDYCNGRRQSFRNVDGVATDHFELPLRFGIFGAPPSFGVDAEGELYMVFSNGSIEKIIPAAG